MKTEVLDHTGVLNFTAKYLARRADAPISEYAEPWRFPLIDSFRAGHDIAVEYGISRVTFVWQASSATDKTAVTVVGTFDNLWDSTPLETVMLDGEPTRYRAVTLCIPKGQVHTYKFLVGGQPILDPINPQRTVLDNGVEWSRFFTQLCTVPLSFETWELDILTRLTNEILPFESREAKQFMDLYYATADPQARTSTFSTVYRLEQPVGAVNFIDKLLAREERHRLMDYKLCLRILDNLLKSRFPGKTPAQISKQGYQDLYNEMASGNVPGWSDNDNFRTQYDNPNFFLQLLRRHTYTGAFAHPKYGGNANAAGWAYLEEMYRGPAGESCFNWRRSMEQPLGASTDYFG